MLEAPNAVEHRFAFDLDVVRGFLRIMSGDAAPGREVEDMAALRLYAYVGSPRIVPTIRDELETAAQPPLSQWKHYGLVEIIKDEFFQGAVKGRAERYLEVYPDPRDCRVVAEAEHARLEAFLTLNGDLITRLSGRTESIGLMTPSQYWDALSVPHGTEPLRSPTSPLRDEDWWRW